MNNRKIDGIRTMELVRECRDEHPEWTDNDIARFLGVSRSTAYRHLRLLSAIDEGNTVSKENRCFAYNPSTGACKALTQKEEYCNTPFCPFYKTIAQEAEEREKAQARCRETGYGYGVNYNPRKD